MMGLVSSAMLLAGCHLGGSEQTFADPQGVATASAGNTLPPGAARSNSAAVPPATHGNSPTVQPAAPNLGETGTFEFINVGDPLTITFLDTPNPIPPFEERVKENGTMTLLYNEQFTAAGKERGQLEKEIRARYVPGYFKTLTVIIKPLSRLYFVGGEVRNPNRFEYVGKTTVLKAIQSAGDFTDFANKKKVSVTRRGMRDPIKVNCIEAIVHPELDLEIFPGDNIRVPRKIF